MSRAAQEWVSKLPLDCGVNLAAFRVLDKLADAHHVDTRSAFRNVEQMAHELRCSKRTVQRALRDLEIVGFIRRGNQKILGHIDVRYRPTVYELSLELWTELPEQPELAGVTAGVIPEQPVDNRPRGDRFSDLGVTPAVAVGTKGRTSRASTSATTDRASAHEHAWVETDLGSFCSDRSCGMRRDGAKRIDWSTLIVRPVRRSA